MRYALIGGALGVLVSLIAWWRRWRHTEARLLSSLGIAEEHRRAWRERNPDHDD